MNGHVLMALLGGVVAGLVARRLRLPGGALVGALVGAACVQLLTGAEQALPGELRLAAQVGIGATIGARFQPGITAGLRRLLVRATPLLTVTIGAALMLGIVFALIAGLEIPVGMLSTIPGGSGDVIAVALDLGNDAAFIATVHLGRQLLVYLSLGMIFRLTLEGIRRQRAVRPGIVWRHRSPSTEILVERTDDDAWQLPRVTLVGAAGEPVEAFRRSLGVGIDASTVLEPDGPGARGEDDGVPWMAACHRSGQLRAGLDWVAVDDAIGRLAPDADRQAVQGWLSGG